MLRNPILFTVLILSMVISGAVWADGPANSVADEGARVMEDSVVAGEGLDSIASGRRRVERRKSRSRIVRRYYRPRRRRHVVIVTHGRRVHRETHIVRHHRDRHVVARRPRRSGLSAGFRFLVLSLGDTSLRHETFEGASLAGIGGYIRGKIFQHVGLEISLDVLGSEEVAYQQISLPFMGAITGHIFPDSAFDIYGLVGGGMIFDEITYFSQDGLSFQESYSQLAGQIGAGIEANLGDFQITGDVRWLVMQPRPERNPELRLSVPVDETASSKDPAPIQDADHFNHALQFMLGLGGNF